MADTISLGLDIVGDVTADDGGRPLQQSPGLPDIVAEIVTAFGAGAATSNAEIPSRQQVRMGEEPPN
jgi:hypothetical protein